MFTLITEKNKKWFNELQVKKKSLRVLNLSSPNIEH